MIYNWTLCPYSHLPKTKKNIAMSKGSKQRYVDLEMLHTKLIYLKMERLTILK